MEFTQRECDRYKKSSIRATSKLIKKHEECDHIFYNNFTYGDYVKLMKINTISNGKTIWW